MIKKFFCFTAVLFLLSLSSAAENSGKDSRENLSSNAAKYSRIISLAPAAAKSLYQLGLDEEIVGITIYCPKGKSKKEIVGTLIEPDLEKIVSLKPDLIVASKEGNTKGFIEKLRLLKFNVFV
ncbi:MAG: helical backbone metal receptor, partial [Elusimicrobiota bacterium]|nr:helical backbone metal receptor [Elusimicrobiota bacterium]